MQIYNKKIFNEIILFFSHISQYVIINIMQLLLSLSFFISVFFYFLLPLKHNIHIIYKLIYIIINILEHIDSNIIKIKSKKTLQESYIISQEKILIVKSNNKINLIKIKTTMNNFSQILTLFKFLTKYHFTIYFTPSVQSSFLHKIFIKMFYDLQNSAYKNNKNISIKVLIYRTSNEINQLQSNKESLFFILDYKKKFDALFYS